MKMYSAREARRQAGQGAGEMSPGEWHRRELAALVEKGGRAHHCHDRDLGDERYADREGGELDALGGHPDRGGGQHHGQWPPGHVPRRVVRECHRQQAA